MNIASSGLFAYKTALETVGNNIANVNTEGYSRQSVLFGTQSGTRIGDSYVGNGVLVQDVERQSNDFMTRLMHQNNSDLHQYEAFHDRAVIIDNLFAQDGTDVTKNIEDMFQALEQSNEAPASAPSRNVFMKQARFVADQFTTTQNLLNETKAALEQQFTDIASEITSLSRSIAETNSQIMSTSSPAPILLDERDQLVLELSQYMNVTTVIQTDGAMNVNIGRGEALVIGTESSTITSGIDPSDGSTTLYMTIGQNTHEITKNIAGGIVEGMVDYDDNVLRHSSRQLGVIAMSLADRFNDQNKLGMDFDGQIGRDIFTDFNSASLQAQRAYARPTNTDPSLQLSVRIADYQQIQNSDYELHMISATTATLTRESDGTSFSLVFSGGATPAITTVNGAAATSIDGFELNFPSAPVAGDYFTVSPTGDMAGFMSLVQDDPDALALASPVRVYANLNNTSNGSISLNGVTATGAINALDIADQFQIRILDVNTGANDFSYEIYNATNSAVAAGPLNADYGDSITIPNGGYTVSLDGPVNVGDQYITEYNTGGIGDNTNGLLLANIQGEALLANSTETIFDRYSHLIANLGTETFQSGVRKETAEILFNQTQAQKLSDTGVSLDEEATNLVSLQQAYQASAQLVQASKEMMDVIFSMIN